MTEAAKNEQNEPIQEELNPEIESLKEETAKMKDQLLRALAEAENVRRRAERDVEEAAKYGITGFARDMISVLENLIRAEQNIPADQELTDSLKNFLQGIGMTKNELLKIFEKNGISRIEPLGAKFDPNFHQAVVQVEDAEKEAGTIVQVVQAGYVIKDRLLRPALVAVSKLPEATQN